jgi:hypothetical protein
LTEGIFVLAFVGGMLLTWPAVPWNWLSGLCIALAVLSPVLLFPHSKLLYLAIDLAFRPLDPAELEAPRERNLVRR